MTSIRLYWYDASVKRQSKEDLEVTSFLSGKRSCGKPSILKLRFAKSLNSNVIYELRKIEDATCSGWEVMNFLGGECSWVKPTILWLILAKLVKTRILKNISAPLNSRGFYSLQKNLIATCSSSEDLKGRAHLRKTFHFGTNIGIFKNIYTNIQKSQFLFQHITTNVKMKYIQHFILLQKVLRNWKEEYCLGQAIRI